MSLVTCGHKFWEVSERLYDSYTSLKGWATASVGMYEGDKRRGVWSRRASEGK